MKRLTLLSAVLALTALAPSCTSPSNSHASHEVQVMSASAPNQEELMQKWMAFATPGEAHQLLNERIGRWSLQVKMFMPGEGEPAVSPATSEVKWIMDGRYVQDTTTGSFEGMPFNGLGTTGYDNMKQAYVSTWIDNMGTGLLVAEGKYDAAAKTFHYTSKSPDVMAGKYVPSRSLERRIDADHWVMQAFQAGPDGKEYMSMEIEYSRL